MTELCMRHQRAECFEEKIDEDAGSRLQALRSQRSQRGLFQILRCRRQAPQSQSRL
jgi:hypothetical protein